MAGAARGRRRENDARRLSGSLVVLKAFTRLTSSALGYVLRAGTLETIVG